jgi:hypothetical protein
MRYLTLIAGLLLISSPLYSATLKERIDARILLVDKTQTETAQKEAISKIVDEEVSIEVADFAKKIEPKLAILIYDVGYQARKLNKMVDQAISSEKIKEVLRLIPSKQYPIVEFPFIETTNDDSEIYWVDVSRWTNIVKMKEEIADKKIKIVVLGVGNQQESSYNNFDLAQTGVQNKDFPLFGKEFEIVYQAFKEIRPDVPVGFIAVLHPTLQVWMDSFTVRPDFWALFNVSAYGANWTKVKSRWFADRPVIVNLNFHNSAGNQPMDDSYKNCVEELKKLGYKGSIYWRTK